MQQVEISNGDYYSALVSALRNYVNSNNFPGVVLGLSGGIDSALSMVIAADALGNDRVHAIMMQSSYTSDISIKDAHECAAQSGIRFDSIAIEGLYNPILGIVSQVLGEEMIVLSQENIQARMRGLILMTISNQTDKMVLATGNKSEAYTGYCTLYGDTCGGFAVLKNVYKTEVYELAKWRNGNIPDNTLHKKLDVIPESILIKSPSAELRFNQRDSDSLPDYKILDEILKMLVDEKLSINDIIKKGYDHNTVVRVMYLFKKSEYKRLQSPVGPEV